jgi:nodulation protein E
MRAALADAALSPDEIGYINAHGTGTSANDPTEIEAIRACSAEHAGKLAISSTKSVHGTRWVAAGALESVAAFARASRRNLAADGEFHGT